MDLWKQLLGEIERSSASPLMKRRAEAALETLKKMLGDGYLTSEQVSLSQKVEVPGDKNDWIVYGTWEDGSFDIIQEGGMFPKDTMVGWKPGQSKSEYTKALDEDFSDDELREGIESEREASSQRARGSPSVLSQHRLRGGKRSSGRKRGRDDRDQKAQAGGGPAHSTNPKPPRREAAESVGKGRSSSRKD